MKVVGQHGVDVEVERSGGGGAERRGVGGLSGVEVDGQSSVVVEVERSEGGGSERRGG